MKTIKLTKDNIYQGHLLLVNDEYPFLQELSSNDLIKVYDHQSMQRDAARLLFKIFDHLQCHSQIVCTSGYRSYEEQKNLYIQSLKEHGEAYTQQFVALPHCSEHETGLAIDVALVQETIDQICPDFPYDGICQQFRDLAYDYGYIERYSEYKQHITHIAKEPWHFRYVGYPHSQIMKKENLCLEEYHDFIKNYTLYHPYTYVANCHVVNIFYVPINHEKTICLRDDAIVQISGNNSDGVIVTAWRTCL